MEVMFRLNMLFQHVCSQRRIPHVCIECMDLAVVVLLAFRVETGGCPQVGCDVKV